MIIDQMVISTDSTFSLTILEGELRSIVLQPVEDSAPLPIELGAEVTVTFKLVEISRTEKL
jgi:hypothetical protein